MRNPWGQLWSETPWGKLWATAVIIMVATTVLGVVFEGVGISKAVTVGLFAGPGWLAVLTLLGLILNAFGWEGEQ